MESPLETIRSTVQMLLAEKSVSSSTRHQQQAEKIEIQPLLSDGSSRRFFRIFLGSSPLYIGVMPGEDKETARAESRSAAAIGTHLYNAGVPVPALVRFEKNSGLLLFEDLGDTRLHDYLRQSPQKAKKLYPAIIKALINMQLRGVNDFNPGWCYDSPVYDQQVMLERESGYFYQAFWQDTLFGEPVSGLDEELVGVADRAAEFYEPLFLHRDFQSRNIMIKDGQIRIIDFQAGRLGPPAYDLASLLIDPYAALSDSEQEALLTIYLDEIKGAGRTAQTSIKESYPYLALQRNLQIVGAFAFLSGRRRKPFFRPFILPALISLHNRLASPCFDDFPIIRTTVSEALLKYRSRMKG